MVVETTSLEIKTKGNTDLVDLTGHVAQAVKKSSVSNGIVTVFVTGSTAAISTIEYEPNLIKDMKKAAERMIPSRMEYEHHKTWGDDNGHAHVRSTFIGPALTVPFTKKKMHLGTWQQIVLLDFDTSARKREIVIQIIGE